MFLKSLPYCTTTIALQIIFINVNNKAALATASLTSLQLVQKNGAQNLDSGGLFMKSTFAKRSFRYRRTISESSREINFNDADDSKLDTCVGKSDKFYPNYASNCTSYYSCTAGYQATYLCDPGLKFDGVRCTSAPVKCPQGHKASNPCVNSPDGYYSNVQNPVRYFYCYDNSKVIELECTEGKVYDQFLEKCTVPNEIEARRSNLKIIVSTCSGRENGFYPDTQRGSTKYYFCINGVKTDLECQEGQVFNGEICVRNKKS